MRFVGLQGIAWVFRIMKVCVNLDTAGGDARSSPCPNGTPHTSPRATPWVPSTASPWRSARHSDGTPHILDMNGVSSILPVAAFLQNA